MKKSEWGEFGLSLLVDGLWIAVFWATLTIRDGRIAWMPFVVFPCSVILLGAARDRFRDWCIRRHPQSPQAVRRRIAMWDLWKGSLYFVFLLAYEIRLQTRSGGVLNHVWLFIFLFAVYGFVAWACWFKMKHTGSARQNA
jgi:hypothetical protein